MIGQVIAMLYNINRKKGTSMKEAWDFVPFPKEMIPTEQSPKEMKQVMMDLVRQTKKQGKKKVKRVKSLTRRGGKQ
jgi:hypothetical protein